MENKISDQTFWVGTTITLFCTFALVAIYGINTCFYIIGLI